MLEYSIVADALFFFFFSFFFFFLLKQVTVSDRHGRFSCSHKTEEIGHCSFVLSTVASVY